MRAILILMVGCGLLMVNPAFAKPDWAGQGGAAKTEKKAYQETYQKKRYDDEKETREYRYGGKDDERERQREMEREKTFKNKEQKKLKEEKGPKGLDKQREMKMEQEQKELGKGSEQGQKAREKRKKWWKFWGGDDE